LPPDFITKIQQNYFVGPAVLVLKLTATNVRVRRLMKSWVTAMCGCYVRQMPATAVARHSSVANRRFHCDLLELCSESSCLCAKVAVLKSVRMISSATRRCSALGHAPAKRLLASTRRGSALQPFTPGQLSSSSNMAEITSAREAELREPLKPAAAFAEGAAYPAGSPAGTANRTAELQNDVCCSALQAPGCSSCACIFIQAVLLLLQCPQTAHCCPTVWPTYACSMYSGTLGTKKLQNAA
jgi:hypothetical protein